MRQTQFLCSIPSLYSVFIFTYFPIQISKFLSAYHPSPKIPNTFQKRWSIQISLRQLEPTVTSNVLCLTNYLFCPFILSISFMLHIHLVVLQTGTYQGRDLPVFLRCHIHTYSRASTQKIVPPALNS